MGWQQKDLIDEVPRRLTFLCNVNLQPALSCS